MYYVEDNHEAIIDKELWDKVKTMREEKSNKKLIGRHNEVYPFTGLIECGVCGNRFVHKINNSGTIYANPCWDCNYKIKNTTKACNVSGIKDKVLKDKFVEAYNEFVLMKYKGIEEQPIQDELNKLYAQEKELMQLKVNGWISPNDFETEKSMILGKISDNETKLNELRLFNVDEKDYQTIEMFDENKVYKFLKKVTFSKWMVTFEFYNGVAISRKYTNGTHGMIQDWTRLHRGKKHE